MSLADDVARLEAALRRLSYKLAAPPIGALLTWHQHLEARRCAKAGRHAPARDVRTGAIICVYCRTPLP